MSLKKKRKQRILFIRDYASFIEVLKDAGFEVTVLHDLPCDVEKVISRERPELIIIFMDGLDYNSLDPTRNITENHLSEVFPTTHCLLISFHPKGVLFI